MSNNRWLSTVYGEVQVTDNSTNGGGVNLFSFYGPSGQQRSFGNTFTEVRPISPKQTFNGVDLNSIIVVYPSGLNSQGKPKAYVSVDLVSTINSNGQ